MFNGHVIIIGGCVRGLAARGAVGAANEVVTTRCLQTRVFGKRSDSGIRLWPLKTEADRV